MAQQAKDRHHKRMVDTKSKTKTEIRLDALRAAIQCESKAAFARLIGVSNAQAVNAWEVRDKITEDGAMKIHAATGAQFSWIFGISDEMFPEGGGPAAKPGKAQQPSSAPTPKNVANEIDALRYAIGAVVAAISIAQPSVGTSIVEALRSSPTEYLEKEGAVVLLIRAAEAGVKLAKARKRSRSP